MILYIIIALIAYAIGSINFSVIISKRIAGFDVREKGSGNAGTTNMLRSVGNIINEENKSLLVQIAGIAVVIGHTFPIFFGFKGGKGVATSLGVLLMSNWQIGLICLCFALVLMILTRIVSLGSCGAAILYPVLTLFIHENYIVSQGSGYFIYSVLLAIIVLFNHRSNIKRMMEGKENRISFKK